MAGACRTPGDEAIPLWWPIACVGIVATTRRIGKCKIAECAWRANGRERSIAASIVASSRKAAMSERKPPPHSLSAASGSAALARSIMASFRVGLKVALSPCTTSTSSLF
jgi:hypothetical protein